MNTSAIISAAHTAARNQRLELGRQFLRVDRTSATPEEQALADRVLRSLQKNNGEYDTALADKMVAALFSKRILHFGGCSNNDLTGAS